MATLSSTLHGFVCKHRANAIVLSFITVTFILIVSSEAIAAETPVGSDETVDFEVKHGEINDPDSDSKEKDFYSFSVLDINGDPLSLEKYRGKVTLVVNVASACGFTDGHYKALIRLKNVLSNYMFEILAFPCNQFGAQEPGSNAEIQNWVQENYKANFPLFAKINVLDDNVPEAWQYLIDKTGKAPNWNFWKYLVTDQGHVVDAWGPRVSVEDLFHIIRKYAEAVKPVPSGEHSKRPIAQSHGEL